ncbi:MAG: carbamoyltransferase HypF [Candidatus Zixiibacteriota bacterium]|nr:MAG: carbamoyltransferase HypF [candidate division Zixibacteria bacterium]
MTDPTSHIRRRCRLKGVVQGVGMRPFLYRLAVDQGLSGFVYNDGRGVVVEVQGPAAAVDRFLARIPAELPPAARLDALEVREAAPGGEEGFRILASPEEGARFTRISPDRATCPDCLAELADPADRRYRYPFTNCTHCGPRLTIIRDVPYDRPRTTMAGFPLCPECRREYDDPRDRRFHAQPNACPVCGPKLYLLDSNGAPLASDDPLRDAAEALRRGRIVAVKGLGGMHLACDAANPEAVARLRSRKVREEKPFALMVRDLDRARALARVSPEEAALLESPARPIVILDARPGAPVAPDISPGLDTLGLLLPYTPLHHLLLDACGLDLVMTSGNRSEEPIAFRDEEIVPRLRDIADLFLLHDRPIHLRADDSVVRVVRGQAMMLRRSRGYVPDPIRLPRPFTHPVLACGAELKSTFCLGRDDYLILSHHLGDLENLAVLEAFEQGIEHFQRLFYADPRELACDLHPDYLSSQYARHRGLPLTAVQHHHAHALAALAESGDFSPALAWTLDGVGLGTDGTLWGGECLYVDGLDFRVLARLRPLPLPGGEKALREPWRLGVSALLAANSVEGERVASGLFPDRPVALVRQMLEKGINSPLSTGAGRLFDAVAALAGVREEIAYEGQAAILLEALALRERPDLLETLEGVPAYEWATESGEEVALLGWETIIRSVLRDRRAGLSPGEIGARFHAGLVQELARVTRRLRGRTGLNRVILTGGVFQNRVLLANLWRELDAEGMDVIVPSAAPVNDGGIALGQAAALWLKNR